MTKPRFICYDLEETLLPNIDFLLSCAFHTDLIRKYMYRSWLLVMKPGAMKQCVQRADRLGADRTSAMFLQSLMAACTSSEEAWESKLQDIRELGFSEDDIWRIFKKQPLALSGSLENITTIKQVLLDTGKYTMKSIITDPISLTASVEKRYKPRLRVSGVLERKNLIKQCPSLATLCTLTDDQFFTKFVAPLVNEISDVWPKQASE